jgi:hypothetical protein
MGTAMAKKPKTLKIRDGNKVLVLSDKVASRGARLVWPKSHFILKPPKPAKCPSCLNPITKEDTTRRGKKIVCIICGNELVGFRAIEEAK